MRIRAVGTGSAGVAFSHGFVDDERIPREVMLAAIGEIIHDTDLKDGKYARAETAGIKRLIEGIIESTTDDEQRLARGFELFDQLHESFRKKR